MKFRGFKRGTRAGTAPHPAQVYDHAGRRFAAASGVAYHAAPFAGGRAPVTPRRKIRLGAELPEIFGSEPNQPNSLSTMRKKYT
jgi:hypothetical protein